MDRRTVWAILLMMVIAIVASAVPEEAGPAAGAGGRAATPPAAPSPAPAAPPAAGAGADTSPRLQPSAAPPADSGAPTLGEDTVRVMLPALHLRHQHAGREAGGGGAAALRLDGARRERHARPDPAQASELLGLTVVRGRDTVDFRDAVFTPSADSLAVTGDTSLRLTAERNGVRLELTYRFSPDDYQVGSPAACPASGPTAGRSWWAWGLPWPTPKPTSRRTTGSWRWSRSGARPSAPTSPASSPVSRALSGPFEWTAIKSKYFVTGLIAADCDRRRDSGATMQATPGAEDPTAATDPGEHAAPAERRLRLHRCMPGRWSTTGSPGWATTSTT